jgi:uncharacterized protein YecT (DUF1311 family)
VVSRKHGVITALICINCSVANADEPKLSPDFSQCMDNSGSVTVEMIDCIVAETKRQGARLNKVYTKLMKQLSPTRQTELREVQRAWIKFRDTNCLFYSDPDGGTMAAVSSNDCYMIATAERADKLEGFLQ